MSDQLRLVPRFGIVAIVMLVAAMVGVVAAWPEMAPQMLSIAISVTLGVVVADIVLIRREARIALQSILSSPEARGFTETWETIKRHLNDASHWWNERGREDVAALLEFLHQWAARMRERKKVNKAGAEVFSDSHGATRGSGEAGNDAVAG